MNIYIYAINTEIDRDMNRNKNRGTNWKDIWVPAQRPCTNTLVLSRIHLECHISYTYIH